MKYSNKKYYQTLFLLLSLLIFNLSAVGGFFSAEATVRYVSHTGSSIPPYTTWETAADSIQKCINICVFGDTIYVANGVYQEQVVMIPGLSLFGAGTDSCEINTQPFATTTSYRAVIVNDTCLLKGFKIVVANNTNLGGGIAGTAVNSIITENRITKAKYGISNGSNVTIYQNMIDNISTGMDLVNSNALVRNNSIYTDPNSTAAVVAGIRISAFNNNYAPVIDSNYIFAGRGQGIRKDLGASPTIRNNVIEFIQYGAEAIYLYVSDSVIATNNLILMGTGIEGIHNDGVTYLQITNNYIKGRDITSPLGMYVGSQDTVKNNVITNMVTGIEVFGSQNPVVKYNNLWNNNTNYSGFTPDTTNLSVDPMIVNDDSTQGELDFHLQKYSPLIDAGDPNILDKDGTRSDIGLYGGPYGESYVYQDLPPKPPKNLTAVVDSSIITLSWNRNTEADFNHYNLYRDTTNNFQIDSTKLVTSFTDTFYLHSIPQGVERLYFKLTGVDNQGNESNPSEEVEVILVSVKNEWKPVNNYILYQNYPNPFNPTTKIGYKLKERGYVKLYVYDVKGELVEVLVNQTQEAGYYEVEFNGEGKTELIGVKNPFVSGVYLCQIIVQSEKGIPVFSDMIKMVLLK
jgi:hypothetical protein